MPFKMDDIFYSDKTTYRIFIIECNLNPPISRYNKQVIRFMVSRNTTVFEY